MTPAGKRDAIAVKPVIVEHIVQRRNHIARALCTAQRTAAEVPPDPAFGLDAPDALHVAVAAADGGAWSGVLGDVNPVTEALYVRGDADGRIHSRSVGYSTKLGMRWRAWRAR